MEAINFVKDVLSEIDYIHNNLKIHQKELMIEVHRIERLMNRLENVRISKSIKAKEEEPEKDKEEE